MKRLSSIFVILIAIVFTTPVVADWEIVESGTSADLNDLHTFFATWIAGDDGTLLKSLDNGLSWTDQVIGTSADLHDLHMPSSINYWVAGSGGTVMLSFDQGAAWEYRGPGAAVNLRAIFSRASGIAFAAGEAGSVFYSDDVGNNWDARHIGTDDDLYTGIVPALSGLHAIVAGEGGLLLTTDDAGVTWTEVETGTTHDIHGLVEGAYNSLIAVGAGGLILRSTDYGVTWTRMPSPTTATLFGAATSGVSGFYMMACGAGGTVIKSVDGGYTWGRLTTPTDADLYDLHGYTNHTWVACGAGGTVIRTTDGGGAVVAVDDVPMARPGVELLPAYPNPFNPQTNLRYRLDAAGSVRLAVFAVDGRLVRTLESGRQDAGWHSARWDGRDSAGMSLPSGVYLARLVAGDQVLARRVQLVK